MTTTAGVLHEGRGSDEAGGVRGWLRGLTRTERNWLKSVLVLIVAVSVLEGLYQLERATFEDKERLLRLPAEVFKRYFGIAHFLLALWFTATSRSMRAPGAWRVFGLLALLGAVACFGYEGLASWNGVLASLAFTGLFLVHDMRDQVMFYVRNGDGPADLDQRSVAGAMLWILAGGVGVLATLLSATLLLDLPVVDADDRALAWRRLEGFEWMVWAVPAGMLGGAWWQVTRNLRRAGLAGVRDLAARHRPLALVTFGTMTIFIVGLAAGQRGWFIVIMHIVTWYVFMRHQLRKNPPATAPRPFTGAWFRTTPQGFSALHIGIAVVLLGLGAVWVWGYEMSRDATILWAALDREHFKYWTLIHVITSFRPR